MTRTSNERSATEHDCSLAVRVRTPYALKVPRRRPYSLRATLSVAFSLIAAMTLAIGVALIVLTTSLHHVSSDLGGSVESLRLMNEIETSLLVHPRESDSLSRTKRERNIRSRLAELERYVTTRPEQVALAHTARDTNSYFELVDRGASASAIQNGLTRASAALGRLGEINVAQARAARIEARRGNQVADLVAIVTGVASLGIVVVVLWWLNAKALRPTFSLGRAMERFVEGDRSARAEEVGGIELRDMAARFNRMAGTLATQHKAQSAFLAGVAHDLRTPLGALRLSVATLSLAGTAISEDRLRKTLELIERQVVRMERMVSDFLDMARIEAGELELDVERCDARELVTEAVELFRATTPQHRLVAETPDEPVWLDCDRLRIGQVLTNLVSNAIKYSPADTEVRVALTSDDGRVVLSVSDSGLGIAADERQLIFEPFRRVKLSGDIPGVGLGLFVTRRIVEAHGGSIELESEPGEGARFDVSLPAEHAATDAGLASFESQLRH